MDNSIEKTGMGDFRRLVFGFGAIGYVMAFVAPLLMMFSISNPLEIFVAFENIYTFNIIGSILLTISMFLMIKADPRRSRKRFLVFGILLGLFTLINFVLFNCLPGRPYFYDAIRYVAQNGLILPCLVWLIYFFIIISLGVLCGLIGRRDKIKGLRLTSIGFFMMAFSVLVLTVALVLCIFTLGSTVLTADISIVRTQFVSVVIMFTIFKWTCLLGVLMGMIGYIFAIINPGLEENRDSFIQEDASPDNENTRYVEYE